MWKAGVWSASSIGDKEIFYSPFLAGGKCDRTTLKRFSKKPPTAEDGLFYAQKMANIDIDDVFCERFTRHEWLLFLNICSRIDEKREAMISMKELEKATQWHFQKIIVNAERLVKMGLIENTPTDDTSGNVKVLYRVIASNVTYKPGEVPKNGFSPRMVGKPHSRKKAKPTKEPVMADVQKRKRIVKGMFDRVNFPL